MPVIGRQKLEYKPYWTHLDGKAELWHGNCIEVLKRLPSKSVQCCITSPPYYLLRSYLEEDHQDKSLEIGSEERADCLGWATGSECGCCFVCHMVQVFRQVWRVLRDDGVLYLNLGDSYSSGGGNAGRPEGYFSKQDTNRGNATSMQQPRKLADIPPGNTIGIPWRTALALQADGWTLRQDIIWHSPNKMPESVESRCSKAHEYVFLLTKQGSGYFFDHEAIKEPSSESSGWAKQRAKGRNTWEYNNTEERIKSTGQKIDSSTFGTVGTSNKRSVWSIPSEPYEGTHFACFPTKLVEPCLLSGTSAYGCCAECGKPWERVVNKEQLLRDRPNEYVKRTGKEGTGNSCANTVAGVMSTTVGWQKACNCGTSEVKPCVVLDPFMGSGTVGQVCIERGRYAVGIELSEKSINEDAIPRIMAAKLVQTDPLVKLEPVKVIAPPAKKISFSRKK
jgi:DNA modification methylase